MKLEEQEVISPNLAKKLKELGVKQESLFFWLKKEKEIKFNELANGDFEREVISYEYFIGSPYSWNIELKNSWSAFTVAELGRLLCVNKSIHIQSDFYFEESINDIMFAVGIEIENENYIETCNEKEADARAKMLIYLIENNLITIEEINAKIEE